MIPGLKGTDHIGITVPNLEEAVHFFVDVVGCTPFFKVGPIKSDTDWLQEHLNVHPRSELKLQILRCGNGVNIELIEYKAPEQRQEWPQNVDFGATHLAFYVEDFDAALAYLREKGVRILGEPTFRSEGPNAGTTWIYFVAPWGLHMELVSFPNGKGYEKDFEGRLWHAGFPSGKA